MTGRPFGSFCGEQSVGGGLFAHQDKLSLFLEHRLLGGSNAAA